MLTSDFYTLDLDYDGIDDALAVFDEDSLSVYYDTNGDGNYDTVTQMSDFDDYGNPSSVYSAADTDHNGTLDTFMAYVDNSGNGEIDTMLMAYDYDQDGSLDTVSMFADTNNDSHLNMRTDVHFDNTDSEKRYSVDTFIDLDGDSKTDMAMRQEFYDFDQDGKIDTELRYLNEDGGTKFGDEHLTLAYDPGNDIVAMQQEFVSNNESFEFTTSMAQGMQSVTGLDNYDPNTSNPEMVSGDPESSMDHWEYQGNTGRCAIYSQKFVIEELTGHEIDIEELVAVAEENGWFNESSGGGTVSLNMDKLLEYYGVNHEMQFDSDIASLEEALNNGDKVIVSVDSGQIWYGEENNIFTPETQADHAVQVIGIDHTDPESPMVVLNDSGSPDGKGEMVPLDVFENAWSAGDRQMIVCMA